MVWHVLCCGLVLRRLWVYGLLAVTAVQRSIDSAKFVAVEVEVVRCILLLFLHQERHTFLLIMLIVDNLCFQFRSFRLGSASGFDVLHAAFHLTLRVLVI